MKQELVTNPNYGSISKITNMITEYLDFINTLYRDNRGMVMDIKLMQRVKDVRDFGVETVAYTSFLFHTEVQWPKKVQNVAVASREVAKLRTALKPTKVGLTAEMEETLEAWANGSKLEALEAVAAAEASTPSAAASTSAAAPPAAAPMLGPLGELAVTASTAASTTPIPEPRATGSASAPPVPKRSLKDRALASRNTKART